MYKDPDMTWDGEFPYDVLAPAEVTPYSSMREIMAAKRYFTRRHEVEKGRSAFESLGVIKGRLFVDFFLHRLPPSEIEEKSHG
jgi:hypothetical protein